MPIMKRKNSGASKGYKSTSEMLTGYGVKPKRVSIKTAKRGAKPSYKIPKTPKVSGRGWK